MTEDIELLRAYSEEGRETAFAELVRRHIGLVHATAMRRLGGDTALAEDVTQQVFIDLARKAVALPDSVFLAGWLHRHTCFTTAKVVRKELRRRYREQEAVAMAETNRDELMDRVGPDLDEALEELSDVDRDALILRFFKGESLRVVGAALQIGEDAAQKRVARAIERLQAALAGRGHAIPGLLLTTFLTQIGNIAAPATLAGSITAAALAAAGVGAAAKSVTIGTFLTTILMTKTKTALVSSVLLVGLGTPFLLQHRNLTRLTSANNQLRQELSQSRSDLSTAAQQSTRLDALTRSIESKTTELNALRAEVTWLRRELAETTNNVARVPVAAASEIEATELQSTGPVRFTGTAQAVLTPGQTLIVGGWATEPGKRTLGLFTPDATASDDGSILINSVYVSVPESLLAEPGWEHFLTSAPDQAGNAVFEAGQAGQFLDGLKEVEGADVLSAPRLTTLSGREAMISSGERDGSVFSVTVLPVLGSDGRSVELVVSNSLQPPRPPTGPE